jgi:hypothetical protein
MYEFSSISVSSYDAASLADKLTEKSAEGWDVVSIVPAGTNVTAYLKRATLGGDTSRHDEHAAEPVVAAAAADPTADWTDSAAIESTEPADTAVTEPAGWATAPEETTADAATAETGAAAWSAGAATSEATPEPAAESAPATSVAAAPAGWYADPSGRYELRYWDGSQWTEHVSRSGQQFTDPPVA